jgi:hypothetical protein
MKIPRLVHLLGATGKITTAKLNDREHLVVPVIALVEGVIQPANAKDPEFVPFETLAKVPQSWNGRPVVCNHPQVEGQFVSANSPEIFNKRVGTIFAAEAVKPRLLMQAWFDPALMDKTEEDQKMLERLKRSDEMIEVSVGAFVVRETIPGLFNGKKYSAKWVEAASDHLAFLNNGDVGACSIEMGCGGMRVATSAINIVTAKGIEPFVQEVVMAESTEEIPPRSLKERFLDLIKFRGSAGSASEVSDRDLRRRLETLLHDSEPGFSHIEAVFPADSHVIYGLMLSDHFVLKRQTYSVNSDTVKLKGDAEVVQPVTTFEPANAITANCGCKEKEQKAMDKAERIKALIEKSKGKFTEVDKEWLQNVPEDRLSSLEMKEEPVAAAEKKEEKKEVKKEEVKKEEVAKEEERKEPPSEEQVFQQFLNTVPAGMRDSVIELRASAQSKKAATIKALKDTARCNYSDEELQAMSQSQLDKLVTLAAVPETVTYAARGVPNATRPAGVPPPPDVVSMYLKK